MRRLTPFLLLALTLVAQDKKPPAKLVLPSKPGDVIFNHEEHVKRVRRDCTVCHDKLVPKSAKAPLNSKTGCVPCHHAGGRAFEMKGNCAKCHAERVETGTVKWFNAAKGYGFIQRSDGNDVFVHFSAIESEGYRTLNEGARVKFIVRKGPKGLQAEHVRVVE